MLHKVPKNTQFITHYFFWLLIYDICSIFRLAKRCNEWKYSLQTQKDTKLSSIVP
ncbi:hypothetical protein HMPREF0880_02884 [Yokenella regensburgei ATCC 43003]|nr:hypothetical protein HMPREF0880_02884 [Yokenella regensburgei ATCC 43003]